MYERDTDAVLLSAFRESLTFASGFATLVGESNQERVSQVSAQTRHVNTSGSIDIAVDYASGLRVLIENKINAGYSINAIGEDQPDRYRRTVAALLDQGTRARCVLVAPRKYLSSTRGAKSFCTVVCYEDLLPLLPAAGRACLETAILQAETPYEPVNNSSTAGFFAALREFAHTEFPDLTLKREPNSKGVRPEHSRTHYFDVAQTLLPHRGIPRPRMSLQCWDDTFPSASVKIMLGGWGTFAGTLPFEASLEDKGAYLRAAGRSLGIVIDTPRLETQRPFGEQAANVAEALEAALRLQSWWNENPDVLHRWTVHMERAHTPRDVNADSSETTPFK